MEELNSIKGNIIRYSEDSREDSITDILSKRFHEDSDLETDFDKMHDPFLLNDMEKAVKRLKKAHKNGEKVAIFGDYDVDGVTSTALLMHFLTKIGLTVTYRLPHRVEDGYGLKSYFIDELKEKGVTLVVTVDCGTRDIEIVKYGKENGIDIIITDHHAVPDEIPEEAVAIINPKREDCDYPFKDLCGAGVAFKLIQALAPEFLEKDKIKPYLIESIDICAIGTVADCMQLIGENRIIVTEGLKQIKNSRSKALRLILEDKMNDELDADIFGFQIGPRLNAAGRLDSPYKALSLLLNNSDRVYDLLQEIEELNLERRALTKTFTEEAFSQIEGKDNIIIFDSPDIPHGIIGIVAGRITESYYKPSIVLKDEGDKLVGSCRSPEYFNIVEILEECKELLSHFGGHKQAAGFTVMKENYGEFKAKLKDLTKNEDFSKNRKIVEVDKVVTLDEISFKFLNEANVFMPFGLGNKKPVLMIKDLMYEKVEFLGKTNDHLRFKTKAGHKIFAFNFGGYYHQIREKGLVSIVFELSEDSWMGRKNLMLNIIDIA